MEFATNYNRQPDDADEGFCCRCGRRIDLNYDDYRDSPAGYLCEDCVDELHLSWKGEIKAKDLDI